MTTRPMSAAMEAALEGAIIFPIYFFAIGFASTTVRLWTGRGDRTWDGQTWQGVGWILGMSETEETSETKATTFTLGTQANTVLIAAFLGNFRRNKPVTVWQGLLSPVDRSLLEDPIVIASGLTSVNEIDTDPKKPGIALSCESRIADLERARVRRYTLEDHRIDWPEDRFFEHVGRLADRILPWGAGV